MAQTEDVKKMFQILPLRIKRADVKILDAAYKRAGFKSRSQFLLSAVDHLLRTRDEKAADKLSWVKAGNGARAAAPPAADPPAEATI